MLCVSQLLDSISIDFALPMAIRRMVGSKAPIVRTWRDLRLRRLLTSTQLYETGEQR